MSLPIVFRPEARAEFDEAADWYEQQRAGLGADFIARVQEALDRITANPLLHQVVYQDVRRAVVQRFPFSVYYQVEPGQVVVIAVFHGRRDPAIWQGRV
jgi:plasmid stabilization system protein ParE